VEALTLPRVEGLLTQGVTFGVAALERAARALTEPMQIAERGYADVLYWLGCSSWVLAAALACEGLRRCLPRRPDQFASSARLPDLLPEADL
jgi:hypothetical protein